MTADIHKRGVREMSKVVAIEHLTLDGVMQGPGRPDEDRRDGFEYGGWAAARNDPVMQEVMGARMGSSWSLLVGRTTYEDFASFWPKQSPNPFTEALNNVEKFVASTTLADPPAGARQRTPAVPRWQPAHKLQPGRLGDHGYRRHHRDVSAGLAVDGLEDPSLAEEIEDDASPKKQNSLSYSSAPS
jgi:hypothetical protein